MPEDSPTLRQTERDDADPKNDPENTVYEGPFDIPSDVASEHNEMWVPILEHLADSGEMPSAEMVQELELTVSVTDGVTVHSATRYEGPGSDTHDD
jgi:hypothetical protein